MVIQVLYTVCTYHIDVCRCVVNCALEAAVCTQLESACRSLHVFECCAPISD